MAREPDRIRRECLPLREAWPASEIAKAIDAEIDRALAAHFGADPAAVVSARIFADRRAADEAAHARAKTKSREQPSEVLAMRRAG